MNLATALAYWVIVLLWLAVLATVCVAFVRNPRTFGTTRLLLSVLLSTPLGTSSRMFILASILEVNMDSCRADERQGSLVQYGARSLRTGASPSLAPDRVIYARRATTRGAQPAMDRSARYRVRAQDGPLTVAVKALVFVRSGWARTFMMPINPPAARHRAGSYRFGSRPDPRRSDSPPRG